MNDMVWLQWLACFHGSGTAEKGDGMSDFPRLTEVVVSCLALGWKKMRTPDSDLRPSLLYSFPFFQCKTGPMKNILKRGISATKIAQPMQESYSLLTRAEFEPSFVLKFDFIGCIFYNFSKNPDKPPGREVDVICIAQLSVLTPTNF